MDDVISAIDFFLDCPVPIAPQWEGRTFPQVLDKPLRRNYSREQWDEIFADLLVLVRNERHEVRRATLERLVEAVMCETEFAPTNRKIKRDVQILGTAHARQRTRTLLTATILPNVEPGMFALCCARFHFRCRKPSDRRSFLSLLREPSIVNAPALSNEALLAASIVFGGYGATWQEAGIQLLAALDHPDIDVRACAAYQIGQLCNDDKPGAQIEEISHLIQEKEIQRPGVAGPFWAAYPWNGPQNWEWLVETLCLSPQPEPHLDYFSINLMFEAHEHFSRDTKTIERFINAGRFDVAAMTATEEEKLISGMEPLLQRIGNEGETEDARLASWHLAYYYHVLHERGAALGFVECVPVTEVINLFLLHSEPGSDRSPYATVLCGSKPNDCLSQADAKYWTDRIFPDAVRGPAKPEAYLGERSQWYQRGYVQVAPCSGEEQIGLGDADSVTIGYRSDTPWNPKEFLDQ